MNGCRTTTGKLRAIHEYYGKHGSSATCKKFNISHSFLVRYLQMLKERERPNQVTVEGDDHTQTLTIRSHEIRTVDQLLDYSKVDRSVWRVKKFVVNQWGNEDHPSFQVKAWLERIAPDTLNLDRQRQLFIDDAKLHAPVYPKVKPPKPSGMMLEISMPDLHYGQLSWDEETGRANYDIEIAERLYIDATADLIERARPYAPEKIVFLVGSDYFNVNSLLNTTLSGTKQDEDTRWQKTYTYGRQMVVRSVDLCREVAPVHVVVIPGNHDHERSFYLGDSVSCWYHNCDNVTVDNRPTTRKYVTWGRCVIGFTHGSEEPESRLPLIMATECREGWADAEFCEWHIGHKHHKKIKDIRTAEEHNGVRVRIVPSLCARDAWHTGKGYDAIREAAAFVWHKERGNVARFSYTVDRAEN